MATGAYTNIIPPHGANRKGENAGRRARPACPGKSISKAKGDNTMPYVERVVVAGVIRETKKMYTGRVHTRGAERKKQTGQTSQAQQRVNERKAEEVLRWRLNANFSAGDLHVVLHYYDKGVDLDQAEQDKKKFLALLRKECRKAGTPWKYVACTETKRMTNVHHHIILPAMEVATLFSTWEQVVGINGGNVSIKPLDRRGNHAKLANYLMKETRSTVQRHREAGKRYKRFSCAQGMAMPEPQYTVVNANTWSREPKSRKGYILLKDDNGQTARTGIHEVNGWPGMEYCELWAGDGGPPVAKRNRKRRRTTP